MNTEIEIQANYLAQQWYNLPIGERPEIEALFPKYLQQFHEEDKQQLFLTETVRIARELLASPRTQSAHSESFELFNAIAQQHLDLHK